MNIDEFVNERKKYTDGRISQTEVNARNKFYSENVFIDCKSCLFFKKNYCHLQLSIIPDKIVDLGCGKGELDIPF